jgi:hypothetical protein
VSKPDLLNGLKIASPCTASWDAMAGDDRVRFCGRCGLNVYNLSGMPRAQAEALVEATEARICVRFYQRRDGTVLTQDCPRGVRILGRGAARLASVLIALAVLVLGLALLPGSAQQGMSGARRLGNIEPFKTVLDWLDLSPRCTLGEALPPGPAVAGPPAVATPPNK